MVSSSPSYQSGIRFVAAATLLIEVTAVIHLRDVAFRKRYLQQEPARDGIQFARRLRSVVIAGLPRNHNPGVMIYCQQSQRFECSRQKLKRIPASRTAIRMMPADDSFPVQQDIAKS